MNKRWENIDGVNLLICSGNINWWHAISQRQHASETEKRFRPNLWPGLSQWKMENVRIESVICLRTNSKLMRNSYLHYLDNSNSISTKLPKILLLFFEKESKANNWFEGKEDVICNPYF